MEKEKLKETVISLEELQAVEVGGARRLQLDNVTTLCKYVVSNVTGIKTQWGTRVDFTLVDDFGEVIISDWNITSKKRFKPTDLIGKTITIEPTKNDKKVLLNVLD